MVRVAVGERAGVGVAAAQLGGCLGGLLAGFLCFGVPAGALGVDPFEEFLPAGEDGGLRVPVTTEP